MQDIFANESTNYKISSLKEKTACFQAVFFKPYNTYLLFLVKIVISAATAMATDTREPMFAGNFSKKLKPKAIKP